MLTSAWYNWSMHNMDHDLKKKKKRVIAIEEMCRKLNTDFAKTCLQPLAQSFWCVSSRIADFCSRFPNAWLAEMSVIGK